MNSIKLLFSGKYAPLLLTVLGMYLVVSKMIGFSFVKKSKEWGQNILLKRIEQDEEESRKKMQLEKIGRGETGLKKKYRDLIQSVIVSLDIKILSVENFTTIFTFLGMISLAMFSVFFGSVLVGLVVALPTVLAMIALLISTSKSHIRANDQMVMDSLDLICPSVDHSVVSAIKTNLEGFDPKIRSKYMEFLNNIEARDMSFSEAMHILNRQLGPRFDEFARKAIMFEDSGEEGMSEIFMDVVDMNAEIRDINVKADGIADKINSDMTLASLMVIVFIVYTYNNPITGEIMREHILGKLSSGLSMASIIVMYAYSQLLQMTLDYDSLRKSD